MIKAIRNLLHPKTTKVQGPVTSTPHAFEFVRMQVGIRAQIMALREECRLFQETSDDWNRYALLAGVKQTLVYYKEDFLPYLQSKGEVPKLLIGLEEKGEEIISNLEIKNPTNKTTSFIVEEVQELADRIQTSLHEEKRKVGL